MVAKRSTRSTKIKTLNQIRHLGFTATDDLRERFRGVSRFHLGATAAALRPRAGSDPVTYATKTALAVLGRRVVALDEENERLDVLLAELVAKTAPQLLERHGVGVDTAAALLVAAGDNPDRLRSEAAFARLCRAAPIPASSGKTQRHRLHHGGDRQLNRALHTIILSRLAHHAETKAYAARRAAQGKSPREIKRCLKRHLARRLFKLLEAGEQGAPADRGAAA